VVYFANLKLTLLFFNQIRRGLYGELIEFDISHFNDIKGTGQGSKLGHPPWK
jgi:hypothetical protein